MSHKGKSNNSGGGVGAGSASVVLIFAVLCLAIFSLITYIAARDNKALVDTEAALVTGYYEADALAERVLFEISGSVTVPVSVLGVDINILYDDALGAETVSYECPVSGMQSLFVKLIEADGSYNILSWQMTDTELWQPDDSINIWTGE